eukprot:m.58693 g.58693  ORF g.58693 m.58693 type:complete len:54 (-) comp7876_c2_seq1:186-347(-)
MVDEEDEEEEGVDEATVADLLLLRVERLLLCLVEIVCEVPLKLVLFEDGIFGR